MAIQSSLEKFSERDQKLMEYVALRHIEKGGLKEWHVRDILKERLSVKEDFENVIWPMFTNLVKSFKEESISLLS